MFLDASILAYLAFHDRRLPNRIRARQHTSLRDPPGSSRAVAGQAGTGGGNSDCKPKASGAWSFLEVRNAEEKENAVMFSSEFRFAVNHGKGERRRFAL